MNRQVDASPRNHRQMAQNGQKSSDWQRLSQLGFSRQRQRERNKCVREVDFDPRLQFGGLRSNGGWIMALELPFWPTPRARELIAGSIYSEKNAKCEFCISVCDLFINNLKSMTRYGQHRIMEQASKQLTSHAIGIMLDCSGLFSKFFCNEQ